MQQGAGLRLKYLGGMLEWGQLTISFVYRETEWSFYGRLWGCLRCACMISWGAFCSPEDAATSAGVSRISPSTSCPRPIEAPLTRSGSRIARRQQYSHPVAFNNNAKSMQHDRFHWTLLTS